jgi:tripeptidyl-peptidase-1
MPDPSQRAVPDLSAYDDEIEIVLNGAESSLSGTSAACPMVAGMLAKINDALAAAGHSTLGFANPFLYAHEAAFLDITLGNNRGIAAVVGYDPLTGLGTFSPTTFKTLKAAALAAAEKAAARRTAAMQ